MTIKGNNKITTSF